MEWEPLKLIKAFIFDLDGVLTNTSENHYRAWQCLANEEHLSFTRVDNERLRGVSRRDSLMLILKDRVCTEEEIQAMMLRKNNYYLEFIKGISPRDLLPGAKELLEEIRAAGLKSAISSTSRNAGEVINRLDLSHLLDVITDGHSVEHPKPAPDLFLHTASQLHLPPIDCVVVEDAAAGIEAANAGGFRTVGVGPRPRVGRADVVVPSLSNVHLVDLLAALICRT